MNDAEKKVLDDFINQAINCKVSKEFCNMQHGNLDKLLTSMDNKLDAVLAKL